jgi:3-oxoacyl-[acyl-carrier-protein] synthase-3
VTRHATITGVGSSLPPRVVPNTWFESRMDTSDEWIRTRTGIQQRHWVNEGETGTELGLKATERALEMAGLRPGDLDAIVYAIDILKITTTSIFCTVSYCTCCRGSYITIRVSVGMC